LARLHRPEWDMEDFSATLLHTGVILWKTTDTFCCLDTAQPITPFSDLKYATDKKFPE